MRRFLAVAAIIGVGALVPLAPSAHAAGVPYGVTAFIGAIFSPAPPDPAEFVTLSCTKPDGTVQSHDLTNFAPDLLPYQGPCTFSVSNLPTGYTASVDTCDFTADPVGITEVFCWIDVFAAVPAGAVMFTTVGFVPSPPTGDAFVTLSCTKIDGTPQSYDLHHLETGTYEGPCSFSISNVPAGYTASEPCQMPPGTETGLCVIAVTRDVSATFDQPIDGNGVINLVKSGRVVPIKATITDASGPITTGTVAVLANTVDCASQDPTDSIEVYSTPGKSGGTNLMTYDAGAQRWRFNFDTSAFGLKVVGSCYTVDLHLGATDPDNDGKYTGGTTVGSFLIRLTK